MRRTSRLLASIKPARYLEPGTPTGLTGLFTHAAPRSTLIYLYSSTLDKLKKLPDSSVYRQSTEALTKKRLEIINSVIPPGHEEWQEKARKIVAEHPEVFNTPEGGVDHDGGRHIKEVKDGRAFVTTKVGRPVDESLQEWDGEKHYGGELEGTRTAAERADQAVLGMERPGSDEKTVEWPDEPHLTADQISEVENRIGAGLVEEVVQVAEGELGLVDVMTKAQVWEDLEEKPVEGQWTYFEQGASTSNR